MANRLLHRAVSAVTTPVPTYVKLARQAACAGCELRVMATPRMFAAEREWLCGVCACPIESLTASRTYPLLLEGVVSTKHVKTDCKHPDGSRWPVLLSVLLSLCVGTVSAQIDTAFITRTDSIGRVDFNFLSVGVDTASDGELYQSQRRASADAVRGYMLAPMADSLRRVRADAYKYADDNDEVGLTTELDPLFGGSPAAGISTADVNNWNSDAVDDADADPTNELQDWSTLPGIPDDIADGDDVGLTTETDPVFDASPAKGITADDVAGWNDDNDGIMGADRILWVPPISSSPQGIQRTITVPQNFNSSLTIRNSERSTRTELIVGGNSGIEIVRRGTEGNNGLRFRGDGLHLYGAVKIDNLAHFRNDAVSFGQILDSINAVGPFAETDPVFDASPAKGITAVDVDNWNSDRIDDADADPTNELQDWSTLPGIPADIADGDDVGITTEADPTVPAHVKAITPGNVADWDSDAVDDADADPTNELQSWADLPGIPADIADGDDVGLTAEADPVFDASPAKGITTADVNNWNSDAVDDADADPTNELQDWSTLPGIPADIADGDDVGITRTDDEIRTAVGPLNYLSKPLGGTVVGPVMFSTDSGDRPVVISRLNGGGTQVLETSVNDGHVLWQHIGDEPNESRFIWRGTNTDETDVILLDLNPQRLEFRGQDVYHEGNLPPDKVRTDEQIRDVMRYPGPYQTDAQAVAGGVTPGNLYLLADPNVYGDSGLRLMP